MGNHAVVFACGWCVLSCGGIVEYSSDDPTATDGPDDSGNDFEFPQGDAPDSPGDNLEPLPDCSGGFAEVSVMFEDPGWISQAIAPSANGLEFYYARLAIDRTLDDSGTRLPTLRTRSTTDADFGEPTILWELTTACESVRPGTELAALDLSPDGLRLYIGCSAFAQTAGATGPLVVIERSHLNSSFELPARVVGEVGISLGLTRDELTAYGTTLDPSVKEVLWYKRTSVSESFGPAEIAAGAVVMSNPEPSPDGTELWGAIGIPGTTRKQLAISEWNEQAQQYDAPMIFPLSPPPDGSSDVSPALSGDCRSLYFSRYTSFPSAGSRVMIARR